MGLGKPRNTEKSERDRRWMWTLLCSSFSNKTLNTLKMRLLCLHSKEINNTLSPLLCAIKYKSSALTYNGHRHFTVWNGTSSLDRLPVGGYLSQNCVSLFASLRMKSGDINLICCHNLIDPKSITVQNHSSNSIKHLALIIQRMGESINTMTTLTTLWFLSLQYSSKISVYLQ